MFYPPMIGYIIASIASTLFVYGIHKRIFGRNWAIGIRSKHTLSSDEAWERGHRAAIPYVIAMSVIAVAHAAVLLTVELSELPTAAGHMVAVSGWVLILTCCVLAWSAANSAAKPENTE